MCVKSVCMSDVYAYVYVKSVCVWDMGYVFVSMCVCAMFVRMCMKRVCVCTCVCGCEETAASPATDGWSAALERYCGLENLLHSHQSMQVYQDLGLELPTTKHQ